MVTKVLESLKDANKLLEVLFDPGQHSCFGKDTMQVNVSEKPKAFDLFFCINALHPTQDLCPSRDHHSPNKPRRADKNVVCFRNLLIEIDDMPKTQQIEYVTSKLPITSIVFSGKKSYHFIISLETPLVDIEQYKDLRKRIQLYLPNIDSTTSNPSRFSRLPGGVRPDTQRLQELVQLNGRIKNEILYDLLPPLPKESTLNMSSNSLINISLFTFSEDPNYGMKVLGIQSRNKFFYWLGQRLLESKIELEQRKRLVLKAYQALRHKSDFTWDEAKKAARI